MRSGRIGQSCRSGSVLSANRFKGTECFHDDEAFRRHRPSIFIFVLGIKKAIFMTSFYALGLTNQRAAFLLQTDFRIKYFTVGRVSWFL